MADSDAGHDPQTRLVTGGRREEWTGIPGQPGRVVNPAVWHASTHLYPDCAALAAGVRSNEDGKFFYGRRGAPTQWALADALTALEPGAAGTMLYPSGLAAVAFALLAVLRPGDEVLISDNGYDPTRNLGTGWLKDWGVVATYFDPLDLAGFPALIGEKTRGVLLETPGSLTMEVPDIPALAAAAKERGLAVVLDNTWASSLGLPAIAHGANLAIMALTKHVGGHSDLMLGSVTATAEYLPALRKAAQALGQVAAPDDCAMALRGLRTLGVRLERQSASALAIARWLEARGEVARVLCPMLPGSPGHEIWARDFKGGCGLFSFVLKGGDAAARARLIDALDLFGIGYSWGGYESLAIPIDPARDRSIMAWPPADMDPADRFAVRLSIGLENVDDLIADLDRGFAAMAAG
ncbi:cystathionine beta-lyase [Novosphingobium tardum]|uniref:Cystathionine beta-lyase n=1 Tax=Novosphingobium tardum TaxID=1538021 RepID=A0ABV8RMU1_9SPHN